MSTDYSVDKNGGIERDFVDRNELRNAPTNMTLTDAQFERLYLSPKTPIAGDLRKTFGNPTPVAVMGFIIALTPISISFMGWRGSGGAGVATGSATLWFGGVLLIIVGFLEFLLGNTFPSVVFFGYGAHFLTTATTFIPWFSNVTGAGTEAIFYATFGMYLVCMGALSFIFLICSLRTNLVFVFVFISATLGFCLATGGFFMISTGNTALGDTLIVATGGSFFAASMFGWYLFLALMLGTMDMAALPVYDLSTRIKGMNERKARKEVGSDEVS